jgi:hypothetical protein
MSLLPCVHRSDGAQLYQGVLDGNALDGVKSALSHLPSDAAGSRLQAISALDPILSARGVIGAIVATNDAPLLIAPGSDRLDRLAQSGRPRPSGPGPAKFATYSAASCIGHIAGPSPAYGRNS